MKKIAYLLSFLLCVVVFFGCSSKDQKEQEVEEIKSSIDGWVAAGEKVAQRSENPDVQKLIEMVRGSSFRIMPHKTAPGEVGSTEIAFEILDAKLPDSSYKIGLTCISEKHRNYGPLWQKVWDSKNFAFLHMPQGSENSSILVLKDGPISETWKGIIFIHEASHAAEHASRLYLSIENPDLRNAQYELTTYTLQGDILAKLGGEKYRTLQKLEISRLKEELRKGKTVSPTDLHWAELDKIFGEAESPVERRIRSVSFWIDSMLKMYEEQPDKKKALQDELIFMWDIGRNRNIM